MKSAILSFSLFILIAFCHAQTSARIDALMKQMTIEEKIGQLNLVSVGFDVTGPIVSQDVDAKIRKGLVGGVFNTFTPNAVRKLQELAVKESRLHIPLLFGYDVIHGHKTIFPIALGLSSCWDTVLIERSARIAAREATADGLAWTFSPMVDIARDPRWGRISEGAGEDPFYGSAVARAMVRGYQGNDLKAKDAILSCVKHFALYGAAEAGRDYNSVDMSLARMYNYYLPPYKAAIDAGAGSVMTSFNDINDVPATANKWLFTDLLRKQWGFKGLVVTDYTATNELEAHGLGDLKTVSELALKAGVDMDMVGEGFVLNFKKSIQEGRITLAQVDAACRRILQAKFDLGLFEDPYKYCNEERAKTEILSEANRKAAREIAASSMVLLKNANGVLPLKKTGSIALVGPFADDQRNLIGSWSAAGDWKLAVSVVNGIKAAAPGLTVNYAKGANALEDTSIIVQLNAHGGLLSQDSRTPKAMIDEAVAAAQKSDVVVAVVGETQGMTGEAASRSELGIPENQKDLLRALKATGKPLVIVLMNGRPLTLVEEDRIADAILETWFAGTEAGNAIADVLFGAVSPSGKLTATFPRNVGQVPIYYNMKMTGRPYQGNHLDKYKSKYLDVPNDPLYPFGYGLSYASFEYGDVKLSKSTAKGAEAVTATVTLRNTGKVAGAEVVQLYITDPVATVTRPLKELKGFQKVVLQPGESKEVSFRVTPELLKFWSPELKYDYEAGDFIIHIGGNSRDLKSAKVTWSK